MAARFRRRFTFANIMSVLALFFAMGGTAWALAANSVGTSHLRSGAVTRVKIAMNAVNGARVAANSLTGLDVNESTLGVVPNASRLDGVDSSAYRFLSFSPYEAFPGSGAFAANGMPSAGIHLPATGSPDIAWGLILPPDFTPGTEMTVRVQVRTPGTNCGIQLSENFVNVTRPGLGNIVGAGVSTGIQLQGSGVFSAPATPNITGEMLVTLRTPVTLTPLEPGDSYLFGLYRATTAGADTCANDLVIVGASLTYV